ncbi:hypothetical protein EG68_06415 [Paragonimus skrjabini miyazakii]|uniref:Amino acid transporter transmembrane domain-containing protein n=1 Tax=Paragonimus skrjabini miyazakii TaxID=59628 RepID=A0A8S9YMC8_9TREM|nr:hypothetical protein EG68_06415 [Paragonimus skrjabini miyazakii]
MTEDSVVADHQYSSLAGFTFLFNVIMGNGPLTLPAAFQQAGWLMSTIILIILCFTSFITFTFIVEAMSITNAISKLKMKAITSNEGGSDEEVEVTVISVPVIEEPRNFDSRYFDILQKFEIGQMFRLYFGRIGNILFYLNICIYLYGDLAIYAAGVPKSLRNVVCTATINRTVLHDSDLCWDFSSLSRSDVYRIFVICFAACMLPFLFFHVTRSRWLQLFTTVIRWISFILMVCLAIDRAVVIRQGYTQSSLGTTHLWNPAVHDLMQSSPVPVPNPPILRAEGIPNLFGVCVYVFMCHHSIPGVVTPVRNKHKIMLRLFIPLFLSVLIFNLVLSGTALAAFEDIKDLYTLNFVPDEHSAETFKIPFILAQVFGYFLSLFPVFALSSTFPILCCTLLGNLNTLCNMFPACQKPRAHSALRWVLPFVVLLPPICIGLITDNIGFLVGFTGAFAGSGIQYVIPAVLVYRARRYLKYMLKTDTYSIPSYSEVDEADAFNGRDDNQPLYPTDANSLNETALRNRHCLSRCSSRFVRMWTSSSQASITFPHASPFQHFAWIFVLMIWSVLCIVIVLVDKIHPL